MSLAAPTRQSSKHPKLDSNLLALSERLAQRGLADVLSAARESGIDTMGDKVLVMVRSTGGQVAAARSAVARQGGVVEAEYDSLLRAAVPVSALKTIASDAAVAYVGPLVRPVPDAVSGQGVSASNAATWHEAGVKGSGVKVAVIDGGFAGYTDRQATGDLPASLVTVDYTGGAFTSGGDHGTGCAEIVHEMAPEAQLYLIAISDLVGLGQAKDYCKSNGISIISHSMSWFNTARGDGSGGPDTPDGIAADARANGILWVNSAGNYGRSHWSGTFTDPDGDDWHSFAPDDEGNQVYLPNGASMFASLRWDEWPVTDQDYDLCLIDIAASDYATCSYHAQEGSQAPVEAFEYTNTTGAAGYFAIVISRYSATRTPRFDLFVSSSTPLQYQTVAGSVSDPASSPNTMAVGAVNWEDNSLRWYSSQGPTIDNRTKPDIAGQDGVSSATYTSGFTGTSASAPHVAGAAALAKQANPDYEPSQLQSFLEGRALDRGAGGDDNEYGSGVLSLGAPPLILSGRVALEKRGLQGDPRWITDLFRTSGATTTDGIRVYQAGTSNLLGSYSATTDANGNFSVPLTGLTAGSYDILVKGSNTLAKKLSAVSLPSASTIDFGTLLVGDANGDDVINGGDVSYMVPSFLLCEGEDGFRPDADTNRDGCINGGDVSALVPNFLAEGASVSIGE